MSNISPEGNVYQAGTLSGNPVAMAAGIAQLTECLKPNFYTDLESKTKFLIARIFAEIKSDISNLKITHGQHALSTGCSHLLLLMDAKKAPDHAGDFEF